MPAAKAAGMALALAAIVIVAGPARIDRAPRRAIWLAAVAGTGYGTSFVIFSIAQSTTAGEGA